MYHCDSSNARVIHDRSQQRGTFHTDSHSDPRRPQSDEIELETEKDTFTFSLDEWEEWIQTGEI